MVYWLPSIAVAPDSRQISVTVISSSESQKGLLLVYQEPSEAFVIMLGSANASYDGWSWRNETDKFNPSLLADRGSGYHDAHLAVACSAYLETSNFTYSSFELSSFVTYNSASPCNFGFVTFSASVKDMSLGDVTMYQTPFGNFTDTFANGSLILPGALGGIHGDSFDKLTLTDNSGPYIQTIWFNQSTLLFVDERSLLSPSADFPFPRVASTFAKNATYNYLYHQISDSILAEEVWDGTSGFWISKNITIGTS